MTNEEMEDLISQVKRASKGGKTYYYWFCPKGEDDEPILLLGKKEGPIRKMGKIARRTAKVKMIAEGTVEVGSDGNLLFLNTGGAPSKKVEKTFKTKLATNKSLKKIGQHLRAAVVVDPEEYTALVAEGAPPPTEGQGSQTTDEVDTEEDALQERYDDLYQEMKALVLEAREVLPEGHALLGKIKEKRKPILADYKAGNLAEAISKLEKLLSGAGPRIEKAIADAGGLGEDEVYSDDDLLKMEFLAAREDLETATDKVNAQISQLQAALKATDDTDLHQIAEYGLNGVTGKHRVKLMAALFDAHLASGEKKIAAAKKAAKLAKDFRDYLMSAETVAVCDENPFGVPVSIRETLGGALEDLADLA